MDPTPIPVENALPNSPDDVFVDVDTEGHRDLIGNSRTAPTRALMVSRSLSVSSWLAIVV